MRRTIAFGVLGAILGMLMLGGTFALATNTQFVLGSTANAPDALTAVTAQNKDSHGGLNGPMIQLTNSSTAGSATPLALSAGAGRPPLVTNSTTRVPNLDADLLDGLDSTNLLRGSAALFGAKLQVVPDDTGTLIDRTGSTPGFSMNVSCQSDPTNGGAVGVTPVTAGEFSLVTDWWGGVSSAPNVTGPHTFTIHNGDEVTFGLGFASGQVGVVWVYLLTRTNSADPRDDGCYFQATGFVR